MRAAADDGAPKAATALPIPSAQNAGKRKNANSSEEEAPIQPGMEPTFDGVAGAEAHADKLCKLDNDQKAVTADL